MFFKQPLYKAKQDKLMAGVELINATSTAMHDVLTAIKDRLAQIKQEQDTYRANHAIVIPQELFSDLGLQSVLQGYESTISTCIKLMHASKENVLSLTRPHKSELLYIFNPFDAPFLIERDQPFIGGVLPTFFNDSSFTQMQLKKETFDTAELTEKNMILLRENLAFGLIATLYILTSVSAVAAAIVLGVCVHPVAGLVFLCLIAACSGYVGYNLPDYMERFASQFTTIDETIKLGESDNPLFPELDALEQFAKNDRETRDSTMMDNTVTLNP